MSAILVAVDTSESAGRVLEEGVFLARAGKHQLLLLHVVEPIASYVPVGAAMDVITTSPPLLETEQTEVARKRLESLADSIRATGLDVQCKVTLGLAVDDIVEESKSIGASCVVLGSHGHGALYHLFSGSVVTGVLKKSSCPILVVPVRE